MGRPLLWFLLAGPLAIQTWEYLQGAAVYGEYLHWTGDQAARLLIATLAATPLRLAFPSANWSRWLLMRRRDFGLATFLYAAAHVSAYLAFRADVGRIADEALEPGLWTGWIAALILVPLAMTSSNVAVRSLGARWKRLHRAVYVAAILTFVHWILTAFDPVTGYVHFATLLGLLATRVILIRRRRARRL